jgi:hypothetical protein
VIFYFGDFFLPLDNPKTKGKKLEIFVFLSENLRKKNADFSGKNH